MGPVVPNTGRIPASHRQAPQTCSRCHKLHIKCYLDPTSTIAVCTECKRVNAVCSYTRTRDAASYATVHPTLGQHGLYLTSQEADPEPPNPPTTSMPSIYPERPSPNPLSKHLDESIPKSEPGLKETWALCYALVATNACEHVVKSRMDVVAVFERYKIHENQYIVLAGFDEFLLGDGGGFLEQIHVVTSKKLKLNANSSLISDLGKTFSPFSSVLFTPSSTYHIPVYKTDGSTWELDKLIYHTAKQFDTTRCILQPRRTGIDSHTLLNSCLPLSNLSHSSAGGDLSTTSDSTDTDPNTSSGGSPMRRGNEGKKADLPSNSNPGDQPNDGSGPEGNPNGNPNPFSVSNISPGVVINVVSEVYLGEEKTPQSDLQTLSMRSAFTLERLAGNSAVPSVSVKFSEIRFATNNHAGRMAYYQYHLKVVIASNTHTADITDISPRRTSAFEDTVKESFSAKQSRSGGFNAGFAITKGIIPSGTIGISGNGTNERGRSHEKTRHLAQILESSSDGSARWDFTINDPSVQKQGIHLSKETSPTAKFLFPGSALADRMTIVIGSFWSFGAPSSVRTDTRSASASPAARLWPFWSFTSSSKDTEEHIPAYSKFCQMVTVTVPSVLNTGSHHKMRVHINAGTPNLDYHTRTELMSPPATNVLIEAGIEKTQVSHEDAPLKFQCQVEHK